MDYKEDQLGENCQPAINLYWVVEPGPKKSASHLNGFTDER